MGVEGVKYWLSSVKMTVLVVCRSGVVVYAAPVVRRFIGQSLRSLESWMVSQGGFRKVTLMSTGLELYRKHRPTTFKDVVGQADAVRMLVELGKKGAIPHCLLFTGPSGCGKTTLARILKDKLKCSNFDFTEINAAESRGIDMVRDIARTVNTLPLQGSSRIWLIDECHALTNDAQNAFLKYLEDVPSHAYFFLATTNPNKLLKTIITRSTEVRCKEIKATDLAGLAVTVAEREGVTLDAAVAEKIGTVAEGSARKAIVLLQSVINLASAEQQMAAIEANDTHAQSIEICRALASTSTTRTQMRKILATCDDDAEGIRRLVLGYFTSVYLKSGDQRAIDVLTEFRDNWYDCGRAGLILSCDALVRS